MTVRDSILALSAFPVPMRTVEAYALKRGVDLDSDATPETLSDPAYLLLTADVYIWLVLAPNVGQGGQSYSFADRKALKSRALAIYGLYGDDLDKASAGGRYGYMGDRL